MQQEFTSSVSSRQNQDLVPEDHAAEATFSPGIDLRTRLRENYSVLALYCFNTGWNFAESNGRKALSQFACHFGPPSFFCSENTKLKSSIRVVVRVVDVQKTDVDFTHSAVVYRG
jgi:hypothetical protein